MGEEQTAHAQADKGCHGEHEKRKPGLSGITHQVRPNLGMQGEEIFEVMRHGETVKVGGDLSHAKFDHATIDQT